MHRQADRPEALELLPRRDLAPSITATTSADRCAIRLSPMGLQLSNPRQAACLRSILQQPRSADCFRSTRRYKAQLRAQSADVRLATRVMAEGDVRDPLWVPAPI